MSYVDGSALKVSVLFKSANMSCVDGLAINMTCFDWKKKTECNSTPLYLTDGPFKSYLVEFLLIFSFLHICMMALGRFS